MAAQFRPRAPLGLALQNQIMPGDQPQYGMGDFPAQPHSYAQTSRPEQKGGFFKEGGMGRTIAGLIGDALLQQSGMAPVYSPMMRQQQALKAEEAQRSRRRQESNQDWMAREQWKLANTPEKTPDPYRWRANDGSLMEQGPDGQVRTVYKDPTAKTSFITADNGDGTKTVIPVVNGVPQLGGSGQSPMTPPPATLPPDFDFGDEGGPTQPASGGFR